LLVDFLREKMGLTGTKKASGAGECGSCTVLVDGVPVSLCLMLVVDVYGKTVHTIEGLSRGEERINPLQESSVRKRATQCGDCTPGMIMTAKGLLGKNPKPNVVEIKEAIVGNICRCTGYAKIIEAIKEAADNQKPE
jgi:carbon-monoxide dehydrogenase small subunit